MSQTLELVNHMLHTVGEQEQITLTTGHPSMIQAIGVLNSNNEDFQSRGWWFNQETAITLVQNSAGEIILPNETREFRITAGTLAYQSSSQKHRYVERGKRVYDNVLHTFMIGQPIIADLTLLLKIDDLPAPAANYLKHLAAEAFYLDDDGDAQKMARLEERKARAWQQLYAAHLKATSPNALDTPMAQQLQFRMNTGFSHGNPNLIGGRTTY